jgi:glycosyltransferase involved in cell wall biosynthesis
MPEITVLMAVHNDERYIEKAVASILRQTCRDFEFLIVDDASGDATVKIIGGFADARIRVLSNPENVGLTRSLNLGLRQARGKYIARMDGDDISRPTRLEKQLAFLKADPACGLVGSSYQPIDEAGFALGEARVFAAGSDLKKALREKNQFAHSAVMLPLTAITAVGLYRPIFSYAQDYDLFLRIAERFAIANIPETLLERRVRLDSVSVKYWLLQDRFAQLARVCAGQRSESGSDFVERGERPGPGTGPLNDLFTTPSAREKRALAAESYFSWALYFKNHRDGHAHRSGYMIELFKKSLLADPLVFLALAGKGLIRSAKRIVAAEKK